jgi:hypothetical protein
MSVINDYLKRIKRKYPGTQAVKEQIEELRDTLNLKREEYIKQGQTEEEAEEAAVASIGDVGALFEEISSNTRTVYVNHLRRNHAVFMFHMILLETFALWITFRILIKYVWMYNIPTPFFYWTTDFVNSPFVTFCLVIIPLAVWPLTTYLIWKHNPKKSAAKAFPFRKMMLRAVNGWVLISVVIIVSSITFFHYSHGIWALVAYALNLPLGVFVYHRKFTGGFYDI